MVIDVHYHPPFISEICQDEGVAETRRQTMAYYKTPVAPVERVLERLTSSGVDKCFLLPHDYSTINEDGKLIYSSCRHDEARTRLNSQYNLHKKKGDVYGYFGQPPQAGDQ